MTTSFDAVAAPLLEAAMAVVAAGDAPRPALAVMRNGLHVATVFGRRGHQHAVLREMTLFAAAARADALVCVQDAYASKPSAAFGYAFLPPGDDPAAVEALIELRLVHGAPPIMLMHGYSRGDQGAITWREPEVWKGELTGPLVETLGQAFEMQARGSLHDAARFLAHLGHQVVLIPPAGGEVRQ